MNSMVKRISIIIFVALFAAFTLCSCSKSLKDQLVGEWQIVELGEGAYMVFDDNGSGRTVSRYGVKDFNWTLENDNTIILTERGYSDSASYEVTLKGDSLTLVHKYNNYIFMRLRKKN